MTYLSRELIRRMIIAEARKKAPLLPGGGVNFGDDDQTDDLTLSDIELTEPVDITHDTPIAHVPPPPEEEKMPTDLRSLYDFGDDEESSDDLPDPFSGEYTDPDVDVEGLRGFDDGESETVDNFDPIGAYERDRDYQDKFLSDKVSPHHPDGLTYGEIQDLVSNAHARLYREPSKKSESAEEDEFIAMMKQMIEDGEKAAGFSAEDTAEMPDDTLELPMDRSNKDNSDGGDERLEETISRLIRESISKKVKLISKNSRY